MSLMDFFNKHKIAVIVVVIALVLLIWNYGYTKGPTYVGVPTQRVNEPYNKSTCNMNRNTILSEINSKLSEIATCDC